MTTFQLYTFQIHPISNTFQFDLWGGMKNDIKWLIENKVSILEDAFLSENFRMVHSSKPSVPLIEKVDYNEDGFTVLKVGVKREMEAPDKTLKKTRIEYYPNIYVLIDWQYQALAIERDSSVFQESTAVANIFKVNFNRAVRKFNLVVNIKPQFEVREFWDEIKHHKGRITSLKFDLVGPNMPRISKTLPEELKELQTETSAKEAVVELRGSAQSPLNIDESNADIAGLAEYAGKGGGSISYRVKGLTRIQSTGKSIKETRVEEMEIQGDPEAVRQILRETIDG